MIKKHFNCSLLMSFFLTGCLGFEHHGHYKVDESKLQKAMVKEDVLDLFGTPLKMTGNDNVFYYMYSQIKKSSFGYMSEFDTKIMRIEFGKDNKIMKIEIFNFQDYEADATQTPEPNMEVKFLSEVLRSIGSVAGTEGIKEQQKSFKSTGSTSSNK